MTIPFPCRWHAPAVLLITLAGPCLAQQPTLLRDIAQTPSIAAPSNPRHYTRFGRLVAFDVDLAGVHQAWISDGRSAGTRPLSTTWTATAAISFVAADDLLWLLRPAGVGTVDVAVSDGAVVRPLATLASAGTVPPLRAHAAFGRDLLFSGTIGGSSGLFRIDSRAGGITLLQGGPVADRTHVVSFGEDVLFVTLPSGRAQAVYATDGTVAGSRLVGSLVPSPASPVGGNAVAFDDRLWVSSPSSGTFWTDGIGVVRLAAIPGGSELVAAGDRLFALAQDGLYVSDGTASGTRRVNSMWAHDGVAFGDRLLFTFADRPYVSDGTAAGTVPLAAVTMATAFHVVHPDLVYFGARDPATNASYVYRSDGSLGGAVRGAAAAFVGQPRLAAGAVVQGLLHLAIDDPTVGLEPFVLDPGATVEPVGSSCVGRGTRAPALRFDGALTVGAARTLGGRALGSQLASVLLGLPAARVVAIPATHRALQLEPGSMLVLGPLATSQGAFRLPLAVPSDPALVGRALTWQAGFAPGNGVLGVDFSGGVFTRIGR